MNYFFAFLILLAVGLSYFIFFGKKLNNMNEGSWEIKLEMKLPDSSKDTIINLTQELSKDDPVPKILIPDYECRLRRAKGYLFHVIGNSVLWQVRCEGENEIQGEGRIEYRKDKFKGKLQMRRIENDGTHQKFNILLSGIRTDK